MTVRICVGSSCCIKGSYEIAEQFQRKVCENRLESRIALAGSFCTGRCNREGVTIFVDDDVFTGITPDKFEEFWTETIMKKLKEKEA